MYTEKLPLLVTMFLNKDQRHSIYKKILIKKFEKKSLSINKKHITFRITGEFKESKENDEYENAVTENVTYETVLKFTDKQCCNVNLGLFFSSLFSFFK